jgi:hypothetical protein
MKLRIKAKKDTKYKLWSTVSDSYITPKWMNREEILHFLFWSRFRNFMDKFVEDSITFPDGFFNKDEGRLLINDLRDEYNKLLMDSFKNVLFLPNKFKEELQKLNIKFNIVDGEYNFKTDEN